MSNIFVNVYDEKIQLRINIWFNISYKVGLKMDHRGFKLTIVMHIWLLLYNHILVKKSGQYYKIMGIGCDAVWNQSEFGCLRIKKTVILRMRWDDESRCDFVY